MTNHSIHTPVENSASSLIEKNPVKYSILINQLQVVESGLHTKTDLVDWAILDYIQSWLNSPKALIIEDDKGDRFAWINYQHLIKTMPLLGLKAKGSVSNRITKLKKLNLIETAYDEDSRIYAKTSDLFFQITQFRLEQESAPKPTKTPKLKKSFVPEKEHPVPEKEHPVPEKEHPVPEKEHSYNLHIQPSNSTINNNGDDVEKTVEKEQSPIVNDVVMMEVEIEQSQIKNNDVVTKLFSEKEQPAAKKLIRELSAEVQSEVLAYMAHKIETKQITSSKTGYLKMVVDSAKAGTFVPLAPKEKKLTMEERIAKEKAKQAEEKVRAEAAAKANDAYLKQLEKEVLELDKALSVESAEIPKVKEMPNAAAESLKAARLKLRGRL